MNLRRITALALLSVLSGAGESCADLPAVERGTCGNRVIDQGEECDTFAGTGQRCRGPEEPEACRFDCTTTACPSGYACNTNDKVCRKPSGTFADTPSVTFEANASRMTIADFDGDARGDVLAETSTDEAGRGSLRVFYFGSDPNQAPKVTALAATTMSPVARDIDRDGKSDIAFNAFLSGTNVMLGRASRTFEPMAYPRFPFPAGTTARVVRIDGVDDAEPFGVPLIFADPTGMSFVGKATLVSDPMLSIYATLSKAPAEILNEPIAANILDAGTCDEVLFAWKNSDTLLWLAPCGSGNALIVAPTNEPKPLLTLPSGEKLIRQPVAADLNRDGHVDLLLAGEAHSYIAFGRGDATFAALPDLTGTAKLAEIDCSYADGGGPGAVPVSCGGALAAYVRDPRRPPNDYDGPIVVFPNAVLGFVQVAPSATSPGKITLAGVKVAERNTGQWTSALIADFNGNGYTDVVAASSGASDIDFYNGTPYGLLNPAKITTDGPVARLNSGDFDGDLVRDLAFVESSVGGEGVDGISVSYGRFMSPPEPGFRMGVFPNIKQIGVAKLSGFNALEQIGVIYSKESDQLALLEGSGDRQLLSAYGYAAAGAGPTEILQTTPLILTAGQFDDDPANDDVVVLGYDERPEGPGGPGGEMPTPLRMWLAPGVGGGRFGLPVPSAPITSFQLIGRDPTDIYRVNVTARAIAADLDADGKDEIIVLASSPTLRGGMLTIARVKGSGTTATIQLDPSIPIGNPNAFYQRAELATADVDGDGKLDLVVLAHAIAQSTFLVAWGNGTSFDIPGASVLTLPADAGRARGFAHLELDGDVAKELVVATTAGIYTVNAAERQLMATRLGALGPADSIAAGDVNADGIPDLVLAKDHRIGVHLGGAVNP